MAESINLKLPIRVIGADGTVLWVGSGLFGIIYTVRVTTAAAAIGDGFVLDPAASLIFGGSFVAAVDTGAPAENIYAGRKCNTAGSLDRAWFGVALTSAPVGAEIVVAGPGSIALANVAGATGTIGHHANSAGTAGLVISNAAAATAPANSCGLVLKPAGNTGGFTDTGSTTKLGIMVAPQAL